MKPTTILIVEHGCPYCTPELVGMVSHMYYVVVHPDRQRYIHYGDKTFIILPKRIPGVPALLVPSKQLSANPSVDEITTALIASQVHVGLDPIKKFLSENKDLLTQWSGIDA